MQYSALLALLPVISATTIRIDVGKGGKIFSPDNVKAHVGDTLEFHYFPMKHSVTQSSFAKPCEQLPEGFNSGFVPVAAAQGESATTFTVTVNDTKPIWVYCAQSNGAHCQDGMNMVVNEPSGPNTLVAYRAAAAKTSNSTIGSEAPVGGLLSTVSSSNGTTTTSAIGSSSTGTSGNPGSGSNATVTAGSPSATISGVSTTTGAASAVRAAEWLAVAGAGAVAFGGLLI